MTFRNFTGIPSVELTRWAIEVLGTQLPPAALLPFRRPHTGTDVFFVDESELPTGSFKYRSAVSAFASAVSLGDKHIVAPSSGGFGMALSKVLQGSEISGTFVIPQSCPGVNEQKMKRRGAEVIRVDGEFEEAAAHAEAVAKERKARLISPDNDPYVIAGSASLAYDLFLRFARRREHARPDTRPQVMNVFSTVVGGGSFAGMILGWEAAAAMHPDWVVPHANFVAVTHEEQDATAPVFLGKRTIVRPDPQRPHLDILAGDFEPNSAALAFVGPRYELVRSVNEVAIEDATQFADDRWGRKIQASGAAAIAAALHHQLPYGFNVGIIAGGNVDKTEWRRVTKNAKRRIAESHLYKPAWVEHDERMAELLGSSEPSELLPVASFFRDSGFGKDDLSIAQGFGLTPFDPQSVRERFPGGFGL